MYFPLIYLVQYVRLILKFSHSVYFLCSVNSGILIGSTGNIWKFQDLSEFMCFLFPLAHKSFSSCTDLFICVSTLQLSFNFMSLPDSENWKWFLRSFRAYGLQLSWTLITFCSILHLFMNLSSSLVLYYIKWKTSDGRNCTSSSPGLLHHEMQCFIKQ